MLVSMATLKGSTSEAPPTGCVFVRFPGHEIQDLSRAGFWLALSSQVWDTSEERTEKGR